MHGKRPHALDGEGKHTKDASPAKAMQGPQPLHPIHLFAHHAQSNYKNNNVGDLMRCKEQIRQETILQ